MEWQFSCERCRISFSNNSNISSGLEELCPSHASLQYFLNEPSNSSSPVFVGLSSMGRYDVSTFMDILTDETSTSMNLMKVTSLLLNLLEVPIRVSIGFMFANPYCLISIVVVS